MNLYGAVQQSCCRTKKPNQKIMAKMKKMLTKTRKR